MIRETPIYSVWTSLLAFFEAAAGRKSPASVSASFCRDTLSGIIFARGAGPKSPARPHKNSPSSDAKLRRYQPGEKVADKIFKKIARTLPNKKTRRFRCLFNQCVLSLSPLCIVLVLVFSGCAPRFGEPEQIRHKTPVRTSVVPGQSLTLHLASGGASIVTVGTPYVSALGEECVQVNDCPSIGAACLRNGEWVGLPDIFVPRPGTGAMP